MRWALLSVIFGLTTVGCDSLGRTAKYDNPVMGPPPPRTQLADATEAPVSPETEGEIQTVGLTLNGLSPNLPLADSQTVAVVNGSPILAAEVLERFAPQLKAAQQDLPPQEYNRARLELIRRDLDGHIERKLLAQALKTTLKPEQANMLDTVLAQAFDAEIKRMMKEAQVNSRVELERMLLEQGTTLENLRVNFENQQMAMEYLRTQAPTKSQIGRTELVAYYEDHREDYYNPPQAKWRQILVDVAEHGGTEGADARLREIIEKLRPTHGANFAEVAREYSDGPNAAKGGQWDWTKKGSLANKQIDQALFELPVGQPSQVFRSADAYRIVIVTERQDEGYTSFEEVQEDIKKAVERESRKGVAREVIDELRADAEILTIFDHSVDKAERTAQGVDRLFQ